jgi:hypothetical protein
VGRKRGSHPFAGFFSDGDEGHSGGELKGGVGQHLEPAVHKKHEKGYVLIRKRSVHGLVSSAGKDLQDVERCEKSSSASSEVLTQGISIVMRNWLA